MHRTCTLFLLLTCLLPLSPALAAEKSAEKTITVPQEGVTKFNVTGKAPLFRLTASTISGGSIAAPKITGKAKLLDSYSVIHVGEGGPLIGAHQKEFVFQATGTGTVTIEFKKTYPTQPEPETETYTVTVK